MARQKKINEDQLDLFGASSTSEEIKQDAVLEVAPAPAPVKVEAAPILKEVSQVVEEKPSVVTPVAVVNTPTEEVAGRYVVSSKDFLIDTPVEDRFVSLNLDKKTIMITPVFQEDGEKNSITLKSMKDDYPEFVTQIQKVSNDQVMDSSDNMRFLERLENMVESKLLNMTIANKGKDIDNDVKNEINLINRLESGEIELTDDEGSEAPAQKKKSKLKP